MFKKITEQEAYWGVVEDSEDPKMQGRLKVRVKTVFDDIDVDAIPWAISRFQDSIEHDVPAVGETVLIEFLGGDRYYPVWWRQRRRSDFLSQDDYKSASVLLHKDLQPYDLDGLVSVRYTESEGLVLELTKNDIVSTIILRPDNSVFIKNGNTQNVIHLSEESLSIGSETESQQPAVVGDDNKTALEMLNNEIKTLSETMNTNLLKVAAIAASNPYTSLLEAPLKAYAQEVKKQIADLHKENNDFFPETLSQVITVDKTPPE